MKLEDIQPPHCHALARRLLGEVRAVREELGRGEDARPIPEIMGAEPREVYFAALVTWRKLSRLATEIGVPVRTPPPTPPIHDLRPGHVLHLLEAVTSQVEELKQRLAIPERAQDHAVESGRQPSDVLAVVIKINREISRALERPFTPTDVYGTVALASAYAARLGAISSLAPFERIRRPADCYERLEACLVRAVAVVVKRGGKALSTRGTPPDVQPGDVYDLANLVLCEVAYVHALTTHAAPVHAFEAQPSGYRTPAHVHQLVRTLEAQLATLA